MTPEQMTALAARLRDEATQQSVQSSVSAFVLTADLDAAADLIESMAQAEPVAWMWKQDKPPMVGVVHSWMIDHGWLEENPRCKLVGPLYLAPPAREPLTTDQIEDCLPETISIAEDGWLRVTAQTFHDFARAVEQAHGIGSEK